MVEAHQKKFLAKVVLLGDIGVGKTTLINKFATGNAANTQATVGTDFKTKTVSIDGKQVTLQMWDTAGQEKHESIGFAFYRGANTCILTFDVMNQASFDRLEFWKRNFIDKASPNNAEAFPFIVVGNKRDGENRVVTKETAEAWCRSNGGYAYFETCATSGEGVETLFMETGKKALTTNNDDDFMPTSLTGASGAIKIDRSTEAEAQEEQKKKKKKCKC